VKRGLDHGRSLRVLGGVLFTALVMVAAGADWIAPYDPNAQIGRPFEAPSAAHWLGANDIGQDILSELIHGTRASLTIGLLAAALSVAIGTAFGLLAGYCRGWTDATLMRLADVVMTIPFLPLMILLSAYLGPSRWNLIAIIGLLTWARPARVIRAQTLSLVQRDHVLAVRALGAGDVRIMRRHVLPAVLPLAMTQFVLAASSAILLEAGLSFLGLGDPTQKSWGTMLYYAQARNAFLTGSWPWWVVPPGLMITVSVLSFALLTFAREESVPRSA
jgi:peptide/nickel transport system permease protein